MPNKTDQIIEPINASFEDVASSLISLKSFLPRKSGSSDITPVTTSELNVIEFHNEGTNIQLKFEAGNQSIWATLRDVSDLFNSDVSNIHKHIQNIYKDNELEESATIAKFTIVQNEGGRSVIRENVIHYNLDVILSVGYRVNSKKAVKFRQWATQTLRDFIEQGYVINEKALRESPEKLNKLAAHVRALRSEEKQIYAKVRECFKICSSDYNPSSQQVKSFYALLQDKFHHAVTGLTGSKLVMDRANHMSENMGLHSMKGDSPTLADAQSGKNYLKPEELYRLHILSEQFLLFAESTALAGRNMTMESLHKQLDRLLTLNDYPVFEGYQDYIKDEAVRHAKSELGLFKKRKKIESLGIEYNEEALASGEYDEILISD
ncbi:MAG: RhuM family protein [Methylophilus sp.]|nr:RhuM family protein [Methylophilus sp.]